MARHHYSSYNVPSTLNNCVLNLGHRLHEAAVVFIETTPGITGFKFSDTSWTYTADGKERVATAQVSASLADGTKQYWHLSDAPPEKASRQISELQSRAAGEGATLRVLRHCDIRDDIEFPNRKLAHNLLWQARGFDSLEAERGLRRVASSGCTHLAQAAEALGLKDAQAMLVYVRCYLRGWVTWDIRSRKLRMSMSL